MSDRRAAAIGAVAALDDPQRRRLYDVVRAARRPLTREDAARAVDISRKLAAFHLDKLVGCGLLEVATGPAPGRRGVGRTPKRYQPVRQTIRVSIPARCYEELAAVLVEAAAEHGGSAGSGADESAEQARARVAVARGRQRGALVERADLRGRLGPERALALVETVLADDGFEPYRPTAGSLRLSNCPYQALAERSPALVCGVNLDYLSGVLEGLHIDSLSATLAPCPGECCVEICAAT